MYVFNDKKLNFEAMFSPIPWYFQSASGAESTNLWTRLTSGWFINRGFTKIDSAFSVSLISMEQSEGLWVSESKRCLDMSFHHCIAEFTLFLSG